MEQNPMAKYELKKFGAAGKARNQEGVFTNQSGNAARDARRAAKRDQRPMTFAEMQRDGMARPAPAMSLFTGAPSSIIDGEGAIPTPPPTTPTTTNAPIPPTPPPAGESPVAPSGSTYDALRNAALANLRAQFSGQRQSLDEELARRGLAASSFGAGRLGDLAGQQSRAEASLEADLLDKERQRDLDILKYLTDLATQFGINLGG